jgi:hypothetical protein
MKRMKLFKKKRGLSVDFPPSGLTASQLTAIAVAFAFAAVLYPAGARASSALINAVITDPTNTSHQAHVDASGNLQVGGSVNVANTPNVNVANTPNVNVGNFPSTQEVSGTVNVGNFPAAQSVQEQNGVALHPFEAHQQFDFPSSGEILNATVFTASQGQRVVITYVYGREGLASNQQAEVIIQGGSGASVATIPFQEELPSIGVTDGGSPVTLVYPPFSSMRVSASGPGITGGTLEISVFGYTVSV